jgi:hypothetical protein
VPLLEAGRYALAYWCRGCLPRGKGIGVQASVKLRVTAPAGEGCPTTEPNGNEPPGKPASGQASSGTGTASSGHGFGRTGSSSRTRSAERR